MYKNQGKFTLKASLLRRNNTNSVDLFVHIDKFAHLYFNIIMLIKYQ